MFGNVASSHMVVEQNVASSQNGGGENVATSRNGGGENVASSRNGGEGIIYHMHLLFSPHSDKLLQFNLKLLE